MKILYVGQIGVGQTCQMRMEELQRLGNEVISLNTHSSWQKASWISRHVQSRLNTGPAVEEINQTILDLADQHKPDLFWGDKQEYLRPSTLTRLRHKKIL